MRIIDGLFAICSNAFESQLFLTFSCICVKRNAYLDELAQSPAFVSAVRAAASEVVEPLKALTRLSSEVFGDLNPNELRDNAEDIVLEVNK
jgi:hypothetical protein